MGLFDRDYMKNGRGEFFTPVKNAKNTVLALIAVNAVVFLLTAGNYQLKDMMMLSGYGLAHGAVWQLVTAMFCHADFMHLLFNMWGLYLFGSIIAHYFKPAQFVMLYLISGLAGDLLYLAFSWHGAPVLGASGAVFGIMMACAMLEPERRFVLILLPFSPLKMSTMVICYTVIEMFSEIRGVDNVAHLAHLGGFAGGYIYIKLIFRKFIRWDVFGQVFNSGDKAKWGTPDFSSSSSRQSRSEDFSKISPDAPVTQRELDALLDKIARDGINSLSEAELARLRQARKQMQGR